MKTKPILPLLSIASLCAVPFTLHGQTMTMPQAPQIENPAISPQDTVIPPLEFRVLGGIEHDSNVLRRSADEVSDQIIMGGVGIKVDKRYSLQRFRVDAQATHYKFIDLSDLDYTTINYNAAWDWSLTPRLRGVLSAERRQYRDVADVIAGVNTISRRTDRNELLEGVYEIDGSWRALAGASRYSSSSTERSWDASPTVRGVQVGIGRELGSGSSITARVKNGKGEYEDATSSDFKEREYELMGKLQATAKTAFDARLAHLRRKHDLTPARDFSGIVGSFGARWDITAKTALTGGYARELSSYYLESGGEVTSNRIFIQPIWKPFVNVAVNARYQRENRDWNSVAPGAPDAGRSDRVTWLSTGVEWDWRRNVTLSGALANERRRSSVALASYKATTVTVAGKFTF